jgi:hypothetical protein
MDLADITSMRQDPNWQKVQSRKICETAGDTMRRRTILVVMNIQINALHHTNNSKDLIECKKEIHLKLNFIAVPEQSSATNKNFTNNTTDVN